MVEIWGNVLSLVGNIASVSIGIILFDSFLPRIKFGKSFYFLLLQE